MLISNKFDSRVGFKRVNAEVQEQTVPASFYISMNRGFDDVRPSADNYQAYFQLHVAELNDETPSETNLEAAKEAAAYVKNMHLKSSTKMEHDNPFIAYQPTETYKETVSDISYLNKYRQGKTIDEYVEMTKEKAPKMGVGNCSDQAILAASYLIEKKGINNVALVACTMKGQNPLNPQDTDQHVFAVIGLDENAELNDPDTWGENAVIVDSWGNITDTVTNQNPSKSGLNKLYALFRTKYMTFENYAKYIDPTHDSESLYNWENYRRDYFIQ